MQNEYEVISWEEFEKTPAPGHTHVMARRTEDIGVVTQFFRIVDPAPAKTNTVLEVQSVRHVLKTSGPAPEREENNG